jgi:hypothetical protein
MVECTPYTSDAPEEWNVPPQCPNCGGFLAFDSEGNPVCNKCHADLVAIPDTDEETGEELPTGKICLVQALKRLR